MSRSIRNINIVLLLTIVFITGCERKEAVEPAAHEAFFRHLQDMCGMKFEGYTEFTLLNPHPLAGARLFMYLESCTPEEVRIPFIVNEDSSRTWVFTLHEKGLLFQHDHRHADGTPEDTTLYGGWSDDRGTQFIQYFPADEYTSGLIPDAGTNIWMIEINTERNEFIYYLERHEETRIRAVFDLSRPLEDI